MDVCIHSLFVHAHVHGSAPSVHTRACRYSATTVCPPLIFWTHPGPYVHIRTCVFTLPTYVHARVRPRYSHPCRWCIHSSSQPLPPPPSLPYVPPPRDGGGETFVRPWSVYTHPGLYVHPHVCMCTPVIYVHPTYVCTVQYAPTTVCTHTQSPRCCPCTIFGLP